MPNPRKRIKDKTFLPLKMFHMTEYDLHTLTSSHQHTAIEISCVISGAGTMICEDDSYQFKKGDVFVFSPGESHRISEYMEDTDVLCLHFEPHYIWCGESGFSGTELLDTFLNKGMKYQNLLTTELSEYVSDKITYMEEEIINMEREYSSAVKIVLIDVLIHLLRYSGFAAASKMSDSRKYNLERLKKSMDYIDAHLESNLDLDSLAEAADMSRSYFCTVFKRYNGIKPWDYITIKRIDKALKMLSYSTEKKINIAFDCGFNNTANFYRAFKKITGRTPGDYIA